MIFANVLDGMFLRSQHGEVISYSVAPAVLILLAAIGLLLLGFSWYLRRSPLPPRVFLAFAGCCMILLICPSIAFDKIIVTPDFFEKQEWAFVRVTSSRYVFNRLSSLRVRQEEKVTSKGNIPYRLYHLELTNRGGEKETVTMGDSKSRATLDIAEAAVSAGVSVSGITRRLREDAGVLGKGGIGDRKEKAKFEGAIEDFNRRQAILTKVELLQNEFKLSEKHFEELLRAEWKSQNKGANSYPWSFRLGNTEPTWWRILPEWDYDSVRHRAQLRSEP